MRDRPGQDVAERVKVEMKIECRTVIEAETIIVEHAVVDDAETKGDEAAVLPPEEKANAIRHSLANRAEISTR